MKLISSILIILLIVFSSCAKKQTIVINHTFKNNSWSAFENVQLNTTINDRENTYKVILTIRLTDKFESQDFTFGLTQESEDGESIYSNYSLKVRDNKLQMIEAKDGEYYTYRLILNKKTRFNSSGNYTFTFESIMGKAYVVGIHQLELELIQL